MPVPIEYEDLTDKAVMWVFTKATAKGDPRVGNPVEVPVRWEEGNSEIADPEGNRINVDVILACDRQLKVGSLMWEGSQALLATTFPNSIPTKDLYEVVVRNRAKDTKGMFTRFEFGLRRYKDKLPTIIIPPAPLSIVSHSPLSNATGVETNTSITVTFSQTINSADLVLMVKDPSNDVIGGVLSYATPIATFTPSSALAISTTYTVLVSGVVDLTRWSFTTGGVATFSLWGDTFTPDGEGPNSPPSTVGVKFKSNVPGTITGVRYWKANANTGGNVGRLYSNTGDLLAEVMMTGTAHGWIQEFFGSPVHIDANTLYVIAVMNPSGQTGFTSFYLTPDYVNGHLTAPSSGSVGGNGVFFDGDGFPTQTFHATNYWVDILFVPD